LLNLSLTRLLTVSPETVDHLNLGLDLAAPSSRLAAVDRRDDIPGLLLRFDVPGRLHHVLQRIAPHLQRAHLGGADLGYGHLTVAELQAANLGGADLQSADLLKADLQGALLSKANLKWAKVDGANFQGVDLSETVGLTQEQLDSAQCDERTKVPAGLTAGPKRRQRTEEGS
jgi:Pentapeptide repeats (8 copies)